MTKLILFLLLFIGVTSCRESGETNQKLFGNEQNLPDELKGLKVYKVYTDNTGNYVKVGILDNKVNSLTYPVGKTQQTTIVIDPNTNKERTIIAKEILSETDEIILIKK